MNAFANHPQWGAVYHIHQVLRQQGYRSLIAGGAVRDLLLSRQPNDLDLATSATPEQVEALFEKTVMVGKAFGVSRVIHQGQDIEVATFRKDGPYHDGRKPEFVEFSSEKEDAFRRDFTVNALFYDIDHSEVIDHVGGQRDLMTKTIRTVGLAAERFQEDHLRVLRALRFHSQLGFSIEADTAQAIMQFSSQVTTISRERIRDEWQKLMLGDFRVSAFQKVYELKVWSSLFPDWRYQPKIYKRHLNLEKMSVDLAWVYWGIIHGLNSKEEISQWGQLWRLPKARIQQMIHCCLGFSQLKNYQQIEDVDLALFINHPNGQLAVEVFQNLMSDSLKESFDHKLLNAKKFFVGHQLPDILVTGDDLIQYGVSPGPEISRQLKRLYRIQLTEGLQSKEELLNRLNS